MRKKKKERKRKRKKRNERTGCSSSDFPVFRRSEFVRPRIKVGILGER